MLTKLPQEDNSRLKVLERLAITIIVMTMIDAFLTFVALHKEGFEEVNIFTGGFINLFGLLGGVIVYYIFIVLGVLFILVCTEYKMKQFKAVFYITLLALIAKTASLGYIVVRSVALIIAYF